MQVGLVIVAPFQLCNLVYRGLPILGDTPAVTKCKKEINFYTGIDRAQGAAIFKIL